MLVLGIAFIALVAAAVVAAVRYAQSPKSPSTSTSGLSIDSPENLLKMRLARGEINEDEYRSRMAALSGS
jgi:putative membrane protein